MQDLNKYQKLTEREHVLARAGMYLGSTSNTEQECWVVSNGKMVRETIQWNPALIKIFDEIVSNCVDEHLRSGSVKNIWVDTYGMIGEIQVRDDGGIPVQKHPEYKTWIPEMIFSEFRTGSNFGDEERLTAGLNGLGSKLSSVFSKVFKVDTCDGKKRYVQVFKDNLEHRGDAVIQPDTNNGTTITFLPDYDRLGCSLDEGNLKRIERRVYDIAGCNPKINVFLNGNKIKINKFAEYVKMFTETFVIEEQDHWSVAVASSDDAFRHVSFVNGVDTFNGGTHVDYVSGVIAGKLRDLIKKKHKVDVKPNIIKQQMFVFVKASINAPMFTSQTKEYMSAEIRNFGTSFDCNDKFIKRIMESDIVQKILDWVEGEKRRAELAELRNLNKQTQNNNFLKRIVKFDDATSKDRSQCTLFLTEGDSASKTILSARDASKHGSFPLKGKPINVRDIEVKRLAANEEFQNIMAIMGLKIGQKVKAVTELRFARLCVLTDSDADGAHIGGLLFNMINQFWPELFTLGVIHKLNAPLIIATAKKDVFEFSTVEEYHKWSEKGIKHVHKYFKGLGSYETKDFKRFLENEAKYMVQITVQDLEDIAALDIAFDKTKADERKVWLCSQH